MVRNDQHELGRLRGSTKPRPSSRDHTPQRPKASSKSTRFSSTTGKNLFGEARSTAAQSNSVHRHTGSGISDLSLRDMTEDPKPNLSRMSDAENDFIEPSRGAGSSILDFERNTSGESTYQETKSWRKYPIFPSRDWYTIEKDQSSREAGDRKSQIDLRKSLDWSINRQSRLPKGDINFEGFEATDEFTRQREAMLRAEKHLKINHIIRSEERLLYDCRLNMELFPDPALEEKKSNHLFHPWMIRVPEDLRFHERLNLKNVPLAVHADRKIGSSRSISTKTTTSTGTAFESTSKLNKLLASLREIDAARQDLKEGASRVSAKLKIGCDQLIKHLKHEKWGEKLTKEDFQGLLSQIGVTSDIFSANAAFRLWDHDKDGLVSSEDIANAICGCSSKTKPRIYTTEKGKKALDEIQPTWMELPSDLKLTLKWYFTSLVKAAESLRKLRLILLSIPVFHNLPLMSACDIKETFNNVLQNGGYSISEQALIFASQHVG